MPLSHPFTSFGSRYAFTTCMVVCGAVSNWIFGVQHVVPGRVHYLHAGHGVWDDVYLNEHSRN